MGDPDAIWWLNVMNAALGLAVLAVAAAVAIGVGRDWRKRHREP